MNITKLNEELKSLAKNYRKLEAQLLDRIIAMEKCKGFRDLGFNSLFAYITQELKLSPAVAYNFIGVARKSIEVPELKQQVETGKLSVHKAQKMTSVLTSGNKEEWFKIAEKSSHRELEREVAMASPKLAIKETAKYLPCQTESFEKVTIKTQMPRISLQIGISEKLMIRLRRAQDLESQRKRQSLDLEATLEEILIVYLDKKDPLHKAKRQKVRGKLSNSSKKQNSIKPDNKIKKQGNSSREESFKRKALPAQTIHQVQLRDQGQCTHKTVDGIRCKSQRFLEVHHIKPLSQGGKDELENLTLLCSTHHKFVHSHK